MNKSNLIQAAVEATGFSAEQVTEVFGALLDTIELSLACGESVTIRDFGKFESRDRAATIRVNPRTRAEVKVPAKRAVVFSAAPCLKRRINP